MGQEPASFLGPSFFPRETGRVGDRNFKAVVRRHHAVLRHERRSRGLQRRLPIPIRLVAHRRRRRLGRDQQGWPSFQFFRGGGHRQTPPRPFVSQTTERWMATARLRLGWAADKWLFFITGGGAWSGVEVTVWDPSIPALRRTTKGRSRVGPSVRARNMRSAMAGRGRANSSISTTVGRSSSIRRIPVRPTVGPS